MSADITAAIDGKGVHMTIAAAGHVCIDLIPGWNQGSVSSLKPGSTVHSEGMQITTGGAMSNTGGALARLGMNPLVIGKVGSDLLGDLTMSVLEQVHPPERMLIQRVSDVASSYALVISPPDADRMFIHDPGPNGTFHWSDVPYDRLDEVTIFHFGYPPLMHSMYSDGGENLATMFGRLREMGIVTSLDTAYPDPQSEAATADWFVWLQRVLPVTDIFLPSYDELMVMLKEPAPNPVTVEHLQDLAERLQQWGAGLVGIKLGEQGLFLAGADTLRHHSHEPLRLWAGLTGLMPCYDVVNRGATGAGDTAIAGLLTAIHEGMEPAAGAALAAAVAAFCVEVVSATEGIPSLEVVRQRMERGWPLRATGIVTDGFGQQPSGIWLPAG